MRIESTDATAARRGPKSPGPIPSQGRNEVAAEARRIGRIETGAARAIAAQKDDSARGAEHDPAVGRRLEREKSTRARELERAIRAAPWFDAMQSTARRHEPERTISRANEAGDA